MKYAYARVSARKQSRDGNKLFEQIRKLKSVGYDSLVVEEFSGSTVKRPMLDDLISNLKKGDTLIVTKFNCLAHFVSDGSKLINDLLQRGISVHILNMGLIDDTPTGKLITNIIFAFAEYERDLIVERTQIGKEIAKTKEGFCDGRPPIDPNRKRAAAELILNQHKSYKEVVEITGLSRATLARSVRALKAEKILSESPTN